MMCVTSAVWIPTLTLDEVVVLPKGAVGSVVACIGAQLADDGALGCGFECQGHDNALDIVPFADDELLLGLSHGPDDCITVLAWVFEADQGSADFIVHVAAQDISEGVQAVAAVEERIIHRVFAAGIWQGPERLAIFLFQLDLRVFAGQDAPVHRLIAGFQLGFKLLQHLRHGLSQCWHVGVAQYPLLVLLPLGSWNQVLVETTEAQRVADINIARLEVGRSASGLSAIRRRTSPSILRMIGDIPTKVHKTPWNHHR
jgi:hypothetical protein